MKINPTLLKELQNILLQIRWDWQTNGADEFCWTHAHKKETIYVIFQNGLRIELSGVPQGHMDGIITDKLSETL